MTAIATLFRDVTYRGREGQIAWMLHRIAGIGIFIFLALHIFNVFLMSFPANVFNSFLIFYHGFVFKLLLVFGLYLGVLYHALNGIRILIVDFVPGAGKYQAPLWRFQLLVFVLAYVPSAVVMVTRLF